MVKALLGDSGNTSSEDDIHDNDDNNSANDDDNDGSNDENANDGNKDGNDENNDDNDNVPLFFLPNKDPSPIPENDKKDPEVKAVPKRDVPLPAPAPTKKSSRKPQRNVRRYPPT